MKRRPIILIVVAVALAAGAAACGRAAEKAEEKAAEKAPAAEADLWCAEHGVPESKCTKCHPELTARFQAAGDWCAEHELPESACPICHPELLEGHPPLPETSEAEPFEPGTRVHLGSPDTAARAGIEVEEAVAGPVAAEIHATARIAYDGNRLAQVTSLAHGVVRKLLVDLGDAVARGDPLVVVESPALGEARMKLAAARARFEAARADHEREEDLLARRISSAREAAAAREEFEAARAEAAAAEAAVGALAGAPEPGEDAGDISRLVLRAPIAGTVTARAAAIGATVDPSVALVTVADLSSMWAELDIREAELGSVRIGDPVAIEVDGLPGRAFAGAVTWIAAEIDPRTRTGRARAAIRNEGGLLKANMFARATIRGGGDERGVAVPRAAIQRARGETVAFVRLAGDLYEPRRIRLGRATGERVEVLEGIRAGEEVVTAGAFLLKTEILKESIGAGCCEIGPPGTGS